mgnify:CR=1 FL=1
MIKQETKEAIENLQKRIRECLFVRDEQYEYTRHLKGELYELGQKLADMESEANKLNRENEELKRQNHMLLDQLSRRAW